MQPWIYSFKKGRDKSFKNGLTEYFQNEPNQANYGADLDVNVWTVTVLNLNPGFPRDGSLTIINMRVWSWLRMNAGGVPNTCKSNGTYWDDFGLIFKFSGGRVSNAWTTCLSQGDSSWKRLVIPHKTTAPHGAGVKDLSVWDGSASD